MGARIIAVNRRRGLFCPECNRQLRYSVVKAGTCPHCKTKICIPKSWSRPGAVAGAIAAIWFVDVSYGRVWAPPVNGVVSLLWMVAVFAVFMAVTFLSGLVLIFFFPPVVERIYANDTYTTLRLDD
jgi:uncharacterized paraquat-inducible protein A